MGYSALFSLPDIEFMSVLCWKYVSKTVEEELHGTFLQVVKYTFLVNGASKFSVSLGALGSQYFQASP